MIAAVILTVVAAVVVAVARAAVRLEPHVPRTPSRTHDDDEEPHRI